MDILEIATKEELKALPKSLLGDMEERDAGVYVTRSHSFFMFNEAGYCATELNVRAFVAWLKQHHPEVLE